ncbi:hypothetical protein [Sunxiuqinia elliptica]|uniref:Uncharacterized protein n=1 Tax=Sunxiuqinia elliptica TaxID=655355 RepID=A0A4R6HAL3_9BACT|nr:hypothetical protein [Sunxiuqinia elliptica]TDO05402.1 hypothetical protein DET52_101762 [Sunxiuqinia elliptica]TDO64949.1 hypothetical protein DET65_1321 [Sunxiuqinia elliptica]
MMRYKDDPRQIAVRYASYCEKCQLRLHGTVAYYWPGTRTLLCSDCGEPEMRSFHSAAVDEDVYVGKGNPF